MQNFYEHIKEHVQTAGWFCIVKYIYWWYKLGTPGTNGLSQTNKTISKN